MMSGFFLQKVTVILTTMREKISVRKLAAQKYDMERVNLKKLNDVELKNSIRLKSLTCLQAWKTWMKMRTTI